MTPMRRSPRGSRHPRAPSPSRSTVAALVGALALTLAAPCARAEQPRIVLVTNHADAAIIPLLRAELGSLGMEVVEVPRAEEEVLPGDLSVAARSLHAVAAFRVLVSSRKVEVWIADRVTGKVVLRETFAEGDGSKVEERVVVAQALELLRASLMEVEAPHPPRGEVPAPPSLAVAAGVKKERERFFVGFAPGVLGSPGGARPGLGATVRLGVRAGWVGVALVAGSHLIPARLDGTIGAAEMTTRWIGAEALALRPPGPSPWKPRGGVGVGAVVTSLHGIAVAPRPSMDDLLVTAAPWAHADLGYALTQNLRVTLGAAALVPLRFSTIVFDGQAVGTYGRVLLVGSLGLEAVVP